MTGFKVGCIAVCCFCSKERDGLLSFYLLETMEFITITPCSSPMWMGV